MTLVSAMVDQRTVNVLAFWTEAIDNLESLASPRRKTASSIEDLRKSIDSLEIFVGRAKSHAAWICDGWSEFPQELKTALIEWAYASCSDEGDGAPLRQVSLFERARVIVWVVLHYRYLHALVQRAEKAIYMVADEILSQAEDENPAQRARLAERIGEARSMFAAPAGPVGESGGRVLAR